MLFYVTFYMVMVKSSLILIIINNWWWNNRGNIDGTSSLQKSKKEDFDIVQEINSAYLKIFISYVQIIMIISNLELKWSSALIKIYSIQNTFSGSFFKIISLDCLLGGLLYFFYKKRLDK